MRRRGGEPASSCSASRRRPMSLSPARRALGFVPSGHIDNLPQGYRELLFHKRLPPR